MVGRLERVPTRRADKKNAAVDWESGIGFRVIRKEVRAGGCNSGTQSGDSAGGECRKVGRLFTGDWVCG